MLVATEEFTAQTFEFQCEVVERVVLNEHKGSALRGALFHSLRKVGCSQLQLTSCHPCALVSECPVSFLLATVDAESKRGRDVPRPFVINPPLQHQNIFEPGDKLNFGLTLFANSVNLLPYLIVALQNFERNGLGVRNEVSPGCWRRGSLRVRQIVAQNTLSGQEQIIFSIGKRFLESPSNPVTAEQVRDALAANPPNSLYKLQFSFHTPTCLIHEGKPLVRPDLPTLVHRLSERLSSLSNKYGNAELDLNLDVLLEEARHVLLVQDCTRWEAVRSYSTRQKQDVSVSGFVGDVTFVGRVDNLLPLLIWGQITHVGKDATKGNGWYSLRFAPVVSEN